MTSIVNSSARPWWQVLNATTLKLLAAALMFLDHVHQMFAALGAPLWLTMAGRLVFPLFLFASAESFHYTRSKKNYLKRLLFASWGMTLFTFALQRLVPNEHVVLMNNAFSTFFVAALYMLFWDYIRAGVRQHQPKLIAKGVFGCFIPVLCALPLYLTAALSFNENIPAATIRLLAMLSLLVPNIFSVEGGFAMVLLGLAFYIFREHRLMQMAVLLALSALVYCVSGSFQCLMGLAVFPMALYNGEKGRGLKNFFYIFYPTHIGILYILSAWLLS